MLPRWLHSAPVQHLQTGAQLLWKWRLGVAIIGVVLAARWVGLFSNLELLALDTFIRYRPAEATDPHITIIGLDRDYLGDRDRASDSQLASLITQIMAHRPAVVGVNVFLSSMPGGDRQALIATFENNPHLIAVEKILPPNIIPPPHGLDSERFADQIGFNDVSLDRDVKLRRVFLGTSLEEDTFKKSFSLRLAERFLAEQGYSLENGRLDDGAMRFGQAEIPRLNPNFGGYVREPNINGGIQTLVNFRVSETPFNIISASDLTQGNFQPSAISDKIIIIGESSLRNARDLPTAISSNLFKERGWSTKGMFGVEFEAQAVSQIVHAAMHDRPLIWQVPVLGEYLFIICTGILGILIGNASRSTTRNIGLLLLSSLICLTLSHALLTFRGLWLPVFPAASALAITGITYIAFYQRERETESAALEEAQKLKEERRRAIERAFSAIHAGPLQTLGNLLRSVRDDNLEKQFIVSELESLNADIRRIGERLRQEAIENVYFQGEVGLDLTYPMHEVFYEVYHLTLQRNLPCFEQLKIRLVSFDPFSAENLSLDIKRSLCWFLEESLCNVGKHAIGMTRLRVLGILESSNYRLTIEDNGAGVQSAHVGEGTRFCHDLQDRLRGNFSRYNKPAGGTVCQLIWPV